MVKDGILKTGQGVLLVSHKGVDYNANLTKSGQITMNDTIFHTPSVFYEGIKLSEWRSKKATR